MAKIPTWIYLLTGGVVTAFSYNFAGKSFEFTGSYSVFLYIGIIFLIIGFVKIVAWYLLRLTKKEKVEMQTKTVEAEQKKHPSKSKFENLQKDDFDEERTRMTKTCPNCGLRHYAYANYCQNCGTGLG